MPTLPERATSLSLQRAILSEGGSTAPPTAGLSLWLKADAVKGVADGTALDHWSDSSGGGNDATQSDPNWRPRWIANGLNGKPVIRMDGQGQNFALANQNSVRTVFAVVRHATGSQDYAPLFGSPTYQFHGGLGSALFHPEYTHDEVKNGAAFVNGQAVSPLDLSKPTQFEVVSLVTTSPVTLDSLSTQIYWPSRAWNGDYAEVLFYSTALNDAARQQVEGYLLNKYNLGTIPDADDLSWTTIASNLAGEAAYSDTNCQPGSRYVYRCVAHDGGTQESEPGPSVAATTLMPAPPDAPDAPTFSHATPSSLKVHLPELPAQATSLNLQRATGTAVSIPPTSGLALWLSADSLKNLSSGDKVSAWPDASGQGKTATQSDAGVQPTWIEAGANGKATLRFTGGQYLQLPTGFRDFAGMSAFVVTKPASNAFWGRFFDLGNGGGSNNIFFSRHAGEDAACFGVYNYSSAADFSAPGTLSNGGLQLLDVVQQPGEQNAQSSVSMYRNGTLKGTGQTWVPRDVERTSNFIGKSNFGGDAFFEGNISEVLIYNTALSDLQRQSVEAYLAAKYALPAALPDAAQLNWTTLATGLNGNATFDDQGLSPNTPYFYRCVAQGTYGNTPGDIGSGLTLPPLPAAPGAPVLQHVRRTSLDVVAPALPTGATSLTLQQKQVDEPDSAYVDVATNLAGSATTHRSELGLQTGYTFRYEAVNISGTTAGPAASVTTPEFDPPDAPDAPSVTDTSATTVDLQMPPLPANATSLSLQRATGDAAPTPPAAGLSLWLKADALTGIASGNPVAN